MNLSPEAIQRLEADMEMDEIKRTDRKEWEHLPVGAWFFCNTPSCTFPYTVMERTDSGCTQVCGSPWTAPWAVEQMKEIAASHNQLMNHAAPPAQGAPTPRMVTVRNKKTGEIQSHYKLPDDVLSDGWEELAAQGAPGTREHNALKSARIYLQNAHDWMHGQAEQKPPKRLPDFMAATAVVKAEIDAALAQPGAPTKGVK